MSQRKLTREIWDYDTKAFVTLTVCPDFALPDGPVCPKCGRPRGAASEGWIHERRTWYLPDGTVYTGDQ